MQYQALACDYDGTLATHGRVDAQTEEALHRLRSSGRKALLVTGRELEELQEICPCLPLFDAVVAENGGLLYWPEHRRLQLLAPAPSEVLRNALRASQTPHSVGHTILATWRSSEPAIQLAIESLGLDLQVIPNKDAIMVLPKGVDKASGLRSLLAGMDLSPVSVVAVGDAENDVPFLTLCGCSVAVANALPEVKARVDFVTQHERGRGVSELIDELLASDLSHRRHHSSSGMDKPASSRSEPTK